MCQPKTAPIPEPASKAPPPPEETATDVFTVQDEQDALTIKKKKRGLQGMQNYGAGDSPLLIPNKQRGINVP